MPTKSDLDAQTVLSFYRTLLGRDYPSRGGLRAFVSPEISPEGTERLGFVPVVLPLIGSDVGYLQFDPLGRVPYIPVSTKNARRLELVPQANAALIRSGRSYCR